MTAQGAETSVFAPLRCPDVEVEVIVSPSRNKRNVNSAENTEWKERAACTDSKLDFFSELRPIWAACKIVCAQCPVQRECLQYALETGQLDGVWGGLDQRQLREAQGVDSHGVPHAYAARLRCPSCRGKAKRDEDEGGNWVICEACGFQWEWRDVPKRGRRKKEL
jgi:WhiB family redox-sensing transcriptional regulator